jgi:hypothetical protein
MKGSYFAVLMLLTGLVSNTGGRPAVPIRTGRVTVDQCPVLIVSCPTDCVALGDPFQVSGSVTGGDPNKDVTYHWEISDGKIIKGQGTSSITVDSSGTEGNITSTLTIGGSAVNPECHSTASCTLMTCCEFPPRKFDLYGQIGRASEAQRLNQFVVELENNPSAQGYVMVFGKVGSDPTKITARIHRIGEYLTDKRGIEPGRIVTVDGGFRDQFTVELWLVPQGAKPPVASPER